MVGVGMSGLPMPKSMMSSPRAQACAELVNLLKDVGQKPPNL
jgi:hypothetical protein